MFIEVYLVINQISITYMVRVNWSAQQGRTAQSLVETELTSLVSWEKRSESRYKFDFHISHSRGYVTLAPDQRYAIGKKTLS